MMGSLYSGATGMRVHGEGLNIVSANLANVNTVGYKQKSMLFQDLISADLAQGSSSSTTWSQVGLGSTLGASRTLFTNGAFEPSNEFSDLSIGGKGFFQVTQGDKTHYTRAGNFRFTKTGELVDPNGFNLSGIEVVDGKEVGGLKPVKLDTNGSVSVNDPKSTSKLDLQLNLGLTNDKSVDKENPFFSLYNTWDSKNTPPLAESSSGYTQALPYFDENGVKRNATVSFDLAYEENGRKIMEYVVSQDPSLDNRANFKDTKSQGLLMTGTLTFSSDGKLIDSTAFTPTAGANPDELANWIPATFKDGSPQFTIELEGQKPQDISLNFGVSSKTGNWENAPANAAEIGVNPTKLPKLSTATPNINNSTAYGNGSSQHYYTQDGYGKGDLTTLEVTTDGIVQATYSNGVSLDVFKIPVFRFTSEDGLVNTGMNHFMQTKEAGEMEYGTAGTENYGKIQGFSLEGSNVEMSTEMVNLIITQRGFQTNSKTISTADQMLQKALELKRN